MWLCFLTFSALRHFNVFMLFQQILAAFLLWLTRTDMKWVTAHKHTNGRHEKFTAKPFLLSHTCCKSNHVFSHNCTILLHFVWFCSEMLVYRCVQNPRLLTKPSDHPTPGERQRAPNARTHTHFITVHHTASADEAFVLCCRLRHLFKPHVMKLWRETEERASLTGGFSFSTYSQTN